MVVVEVLLIAKLLRLKPKLVKPLQMLLYELKYYKMYKRVYLHLFYVQLNLKYASNAASINSPSTDGEVIVVPMTLIILRRIGLLAVLFKSHDVQLMRRCSIRTPC